MKHRKNQKITRKKKAAPMTNAQKELKELREQLAEFKELSTSGFAALAECTNMATIVGSRVGTHIEKGTLNSNGINLATNFAGISKAIRILKNDMDNIASEITEENLVDDDEFNRPFRMLTAGQQLSELIHITQDKVLAGIVVLSEQIDAYEEDKDVSINPLSIFPSFTKKEDGTTELADESEMSEAFNNAILTDN